MKDDGIREPSRNFEFLKFIHKQQRYVHLKSPNIKFISGLAFFHLLKGDIAGFEYILRFHVSPNNIKTSSKQ